MPDAGSDSTSSSEGDLAAFRQVAVSWQGQQWSNEQVKSGHHLCSAPCLVVLRSVNHTGCGLMGEASRRLRLMQGLRKPVAAGKATSTVATSNIEADRESTLPSSFQDQVSCREGSQSVMHPEYIRASLKYTIVSMPCSCTVHCARDSKPA